MSPGTYLNVGCGRRDPNQVNPLVAEGWKEIRMDIDPAVEPDLVGSMTAIPLEDASVEVVFTSHALEHLTPPDAVQALREFFRVLKPGGRALVVVPDLQTAAQRIADGRALEMLYLAPIGPVCALDVVYGHRDLSNLNPHMAHRTGFTAPILQALMVDAGFEVEVFRDEPVEFSLCADARKPA